jgi:predicted transposase YdaD
LKENLKENLKEKLEGKLEGKLEAKLEMIFAMSNDGFDTVRIAKIVKMSPEEVSDIINKR